MKKNTAIKIVAALVLILAVYIGGMMALKSGDADGPERMINVYMDGEKFGTYSGKFDVEVTDYATGTLDRRLIVTATNGIKIFTYDGKFDIEVIGPAESNNVSGTEKTLNVYTITGKELATYSGKFDVEYNDRGEVMFDLNGKSHTYYNALVEVIEE